MPAETTASSTAPARRPAALSAALRPPPEGTPAGRGAPAVHLVTRRPDGPAGSAPAVTAVSAASDRGARIVAVVIAFAWHGAIGLPAIALTWPQLTAPAVVAAGWLVFAAVGAYAGCRLLRGDPVPTWPLVGVLLLVHAVLFPAAGEDFLFHSANFGWGTLGWFALLLLWGRRVRWLVAVMAANAVIALVAVLAYGEANAADLSRYTMYVYGTAVLPICLAAGVRGMSALAGQRAASAAASAAIEAERVAAERASRDRRARLRLAAEMASDVLRDLAEGRADATDPDVQRRCALAASRLRRLIAESDDVPEPLLHELRACADLAERHGLPVELITVGTPPRLPVQVRRQLAAALTQARDWARLTVMARPDELVVSLVTPSEATPHPAATGQPGSAPADARGVGVVECVYERDEELTWVQTRWRNE